MEGKNILRIILTVVIVVPFIWINVKECSARDEVLADHSYTFGWLVNYRSIGDGRHANLTYHYRVRGRTYERTIRPDVDFSYCLKHFSPCANRRFVVIYSNKHPEESLIALRDEIVGSGKIDSRKGLDNFE